MHSRRFPSRRLLAALAAVATVAATPVRAQDGHVYGFVGAWTYQARGSVENNGPPLDFERDLGLEGRKYGDLALGFLPASRQSAWLPAMSLGYTHFIERGVQQVQTPILFGLVTLDGEAESSADVDDLQLSLRWPWRITPALRLEGGINITRLDGAVIVTDVDSGQRNRQPVDEIVPAPSLAIAWNPLPALRLRARADYVTYQGQQAQTLEADAYWQMFGPVGLEAGWRQRRYHVETSNEFGPYRLDARLSGLRIGVRFELPY